jgi:hypothetical protein
MTAHSRFHRPRCFTRRARVGRGVAVTADSARRHADQTGPASLAAAAQVASVIDQPLSSPTPRHVPRRPVLLWRFNPHSEPPA